jgi:hypothetical protein
MKAIRKIRAAGMLLALVWQAGMAAAQGADPVLLGEFDAWAAYTYKAADSRVCYASSRPKDSDSTPKNSKRDPPFFLVTYMPDRKPPVRAEVSTLIGYPFKKESAVELVVDATKFAMRPLDNVAWAEDAATDKKIVAAMKAGKQMVLKGTSWRGTVTTDTYSLDGMAAALAKAQDACK